jgi:hypothetical protein
MNEGRRDDSSLLLNNKLLLHCDHVEIVSDSLTAVLDVSAVGQVYKTSSHNLGSHTPAQHFGRGFSGVA